jgi:hypothetical protein
MDIHGHQIFSGSSQSGPVGADGHWLLTFTGVPASKFQSISLRMRDYDEAVQFSDISLTPGQATKVQTSVDSGKQ